MVDGRWWLSTVSHARTVRCIAVRCSAVQCSADCRTVRSYEVHMGWRADWQKLLRLYASTPDRMSRSHAPGPCWVPAPTPVMPSGHLPSSLHIPGRFAPCPPRLSTHTGSPPRASPVRDFPAVQGSPLLGASPPLLYSGPPHHPVLRFRSRGLLG